MARDPEVVEIDIAEVQELLARTKDRLPPEDYDKWHSLVETILTLMKLVRERGTTIARLRRLFGLASSEKTADVLEKIGRRETAAAARRHAAQPAGAPPTLSRNPDAGLDAVGCRQRARGRAGARLPRVALDRRPGHRRAQRRHVHAHSCVHGEAAPPALAPRRLA